MQAPPLNWKTPSLGSLAQSYFGSASSVARLAPMVILSLITVLIPRRFLAVGVNGDGFLICLVAFSLLVSPYSWLYDQLLLLPVILWGYKRVGDLNHRPFLRGMFGFLPVILNFLLFVGGSDGQELYIWYPLMVSVYGASILTIGAVKRDISSYSR